MPAGSISWSWVSGKPAEKKQFFISDAILIDLWPAGEQAAVLEVIDAFSS